MGKLERVIFIEIMLWVVNNLQPGVDHVVFRGKCYYKDTEEDMTRLYEEWEKDI